MSTRADVIKDYPWRKLFVLGVFFIGCSVLFVRAVELQVFQHDFLQKMGDARHIRNVKISSSRGMIVDRNGEPLAISAPVDSIWINPKVATVSDEQLRELGQLLNVTRDRLKGRFQLKKKEFVYLKRHLTPEDANKVLDIGIRGLYAEREYRRYYPEGEVFGHVLGFTNIDDQGQEGIELAYNEWLTGVEGKKKIIQDRQGKVVENLELIKAAQPGKTLQLSIDRNIQYLAYSELKAAVKAHGAKSGSVVVLDSKTGDILAMVNQPSFNPNDREQLISSLYRNRVVNDLFEPGSTIKPFTVAAALESGLYSENSLVDTAPGRLVVSGHTIKDTSNHGLIDLDTVITKSSNVGVSKLSMTMPMEGLWNLFDKVGFGHSTQSGFPGEVDGVLRSYDQWYPVDRATIAFGYGMSVTPLQLAQGYAVLANAGNYTPVSFIKNDTRKSDPIAVMQEQTADAVKRMMQNVVEPGGTGYRAAIAGYRVAGKTGTVKKSSIGGYSESLYTSVFAGVAPAVDSRLVAVVVVNEPSNGSYYAGEVAAPVFSRVMAGAIRLLNIPPDDEGGVDGSQNLINRERRI